MSGIAPVPPADLVDQVVWIGARHADMWALSDDRLAGTAPTPAQYVRGMVSTTVRHLLEVGLLQVADNVMAVIEDGVEVGPVPSTWPVR